MTIAKSILEGTKRKKNQAIGENPEMPAPTGVVVKTGSGLIKNHKEIAGTMSPPHVSSEYNCLRVTLE